MNEERNQGFDEVIVGSFMGTAFVGIVEWWITNGMPYPPHNHGKPSWGIA